MAEHHLVNQRMALGSMSRLPLNTSRDRDSTASVGSPFQCLITRFVNKLLQMSNWNLLRNILRLGPLVLLLTAWEKRLIPTSLTPTFAAKSANELRPPMHDHLFCRKRKEVYSGSLRQQPWRVRRDRSAGYKADNLYTRAQKRQ